MFGGLGPSLPSQAFWGLRDIHSLKLLNWALRIYWSLLERFGPLRAWSGLPVSIPEEAKDLFLAATKCNLGNEWHDKWLEGHSSFDIAPNLFPLIRAKGGKQRLVADCLHDDQWIQDIEGPFLCLPSLNS